MLLVFAGGIVFLGLLLSALLALTFLPVLFGMGRNSEYIYIIGVGVVVACIFGTHLYHKMIADEKEKMGCIITGILAGLAAGVLWPFLPFVWLWEVYKKWEDQRNRRNVLAYLEEQHKQEEG